MSIGYPKRLPLKGGVFIIKTIFIKITLSKLYAQQKSDPQMRVAFLNLCWHRSIFPGSRPPSIFDTDELNFCVRNGNRWILIAISTNYLLAGLQTSKKSCNFVPSKSNNENMLCKGPSNTWSSPRPISTAKLNASRHLHLQPINLVVFKGSYLVNPVGYLISGAASCLDAFSVYPFRT